MAIFEGLAGIRLRPNAEPTYIHAVCKQELKQYPALHNRDEPPYVLKCDACDKIVGEWITQAAMNHELVAWFEANAARHSLIHS
jgi:hypothetical protein